MKSSCFILFHSCASTPHKVSAPQPHANHMTKVEDSNGSCDTHILTRTHTHMIQAPHSSGVAAAAVAQLPFVTAEGFGGAAAWSARAAEVWDAHGMSAGVDVVQLAGGGGGSDSSSAPASVPAAAAAAEHGGRVVRDMPLDVALPVARATKETAPGGARSARTAAPGAQRATVAAAAAPSPTRSFFDLMGGAGGSGGTAAVARVSAAQPRARLAVVDDRGKRARTLSAPSSDGSGGRGGSSTQSPGKLLCLDELLGPSAALAASAGGAGRSRPHAPGTAAARGTRALAPVYDTVAAGFAIGGGLPRGDAAVIGDLPLDTASASPAVGLAATAGTHALAQPEGASTGVEVAASALGAHGTASAAGNGARTGAVGGIGSGAAAAASNAPVYLPQKRKPPAAFLSADSGRLALPARAHSQEGALQAKPRGRVGAKQSAPAPRPAAAGAGKGGPADDILDMLLGS